MAEKRLTHTVTVDLAKETWSSRPVLVQNSDNTFLITVLNDGEPADLSDVRDIVLAVIPSRKKANDSVFSPGVKVGSTSQVKIDLGRAAVATPGIVQAQLKLTGTNGGLISSTSFNFEVQMDAGLNFQPSENELTLIETVLGDGPTVLANATQTIADMESTQATLTGAVGGAISSLNEDKAAAIEELDTAKTTAVNELAEVREANRFRQLDAVATVADRDTTYPNPEHGDTVRVTSDATMYKYNKDAGWVVSDRYDATAVDALNQQLADKAGKSELLQTNTEVSGLDQRIDSLVIPISPENANIEVTDARVSVAKGKTFSTLRNRFEESESEVLSIKETEIRDNEIFFELPNGTKNTVSEGTLTKNVKEHILTASDIIGTYTGSNISIVRIAKPTDYKGYGVTPSTSSGEYNNTGHHEFGINFTTLLTAPYDRTEHIGKMVLDQSEKQIWYIVAKDSLTLEAAKSLLVGTKMRYQLATPVSVPLKASAKVRELLKLKERVGGIPTEVVIADDSITTAKRTELGEMAIITVSSSGSLPDHNTKLNTITFTSNFFVFNRDKRYTVQAQTLPYLEKTDPTSTGVVIYFNTANSTFIYRLQNQLQNIPESAVLFAIAYKVSNEWHLNMNCDFTINGKSLGEGSGGGNGRVVPSYAFPPDIAEGFFVESPEKTYEFFDSANDVIQGFRSLASSHSGFVTESLFGNDSSGQYPIYGYKINPGGASTAGLTRGYPRIIWVAGQHGTEKTAVMSSYHFVKNMLENWQSHPVLEWLRWNFVFEFIPLANPYGYDQGNGYTGDANSGRLNANGVNLNRNWSVGWAQGTSGADYGGTAPFSEVETQYMKALVDKSTKALAFIDFHTNNSTGEAYNNLLWISNNAGDLQDEDLLLSSKYTVEKQSREFVKKYNLPTTDYYPFGYVSASNISTGSAKAYGATKGIPSTTFECFRKFPTETEFYSNDTLQACTEYLANFVKTVITQEMLVY